MARKPTFITPPNKLKEKAGSGGLPAHILQKGQSYLESNPVDFTPFAGDLLSALKKYMGTVQPDQPTEKTLGEITKIIMQLKANGSMFQYQLISMISDVLLRFVEKVKRVEADFIDIIKVYINILTIVLEKKLTGNGGTEGYLLTEELHHACERYNKKYDIS